MLLHFLKSDIFNFIFEFEKMFFINQNELKCYNSN